MSDRILHYPSGQANLVGGFVQLLSYAGGRNLPHGAALCDRSAQRFGSDFGGSKLDKKAFTTLKEATVFDRPHVKRSAWAGTESLPKVFYQNVKSFSQRDLPTFKTREEALEWLGKE